MNCGSIFFKHYHITLHAQLYIAPINSLCMSYSVYVTELFSKWCYNKGALYGNFNEK